MRGGGLDLTKTKRELFWDEFKSIRGLWNGSWCVAGNFILIHFPRKLTKEGPFLL